MCVRKRTNESNLHQVYGRAEWVEPFAAGGLPDQHAASEFKLDRRGLADGEPNNSDGDPGCERQDRGQHVSNHARDGAPAHDTGAVYLHGAEQPAARARQVSSAPGLSKPDRPAGRQHQPVHRACRQCNAEPDIQRRHDRPGRVDLESILSVWREVRQRTRGLRGGTRFKSFRGGACSSVPTSAASVASPIPRAP